MPKLGFLQDIIDRGAPGSGLKARAILGRLSRTQLPEGALLPSTEGLGVADNGDIVALSGGVWIRAGFAGGNWTRFTWVEADGNVRFDVVVPKKLAEIMDAFEGGGWADSRTAQVSDSIKVGSAPHTASEITGLTYVDYRTQPSPNSEAGYIAVRVLAQNAGKVGEGKLRTIEGNRSDRRAYDPTILLTAAQHITDSGDYSYYSVYDADGFVSDDATWVQELDPFELRDNYVSPAFNPFTAQSWSAGTGNLLGATSSTTAYTRHNNNVRTVSIWGNAHAVGATTGGFYIPVRIPIALKSALDHYRLTSTRDGSAHAITAGQHVVDDATYAYYNVYFPAGAATTVALEVRVGHVFNPALATIMWRALADTPDSYSGQAGKLVVVKAGEDGLEFAEYVAGSSAITINGFVIDVDQTAFDILQLGQAQNSTNQVFLTTANGTPRRTVLPGGAFNIHENNLIVVEWAIGDERDSKNVQSAILRRNAAIAAKTGTEASGDKYYPIDAGYDSAGNRRELRLYRSADNELILGGALLTTETTATHANNQLTTEAGSSPPAAFTATVSLYEIGGNAGAAARQQQIVSLAPRYWTGYIETAVGTTPNLPIRFDGVSWTGVDAWSRDRLPGAPAAGRTRWFGSATAVYNPAATFDWSIEGATVAPLTDRRFSSVPNARDPSLITSGPTAASLYWNAYEDGAGWSRYWYPLLSNPDWLYLDATDWRPNAIDSTANIDFPEQDGATLAGLTLWVEVYNSGGHDVFYRVPFNLVPLPNVQAAAVGTVTQTHLNGWEMHWEHRVRSADIFFSDLNLPGGANQANYHKLACNGQLQHRSAPGSTRFNRIALKAPGVYRTNGDILWRFEVWARRQ